MELAHMIIEDDKFKSAVWIGRWRSRGANGADEDEVQR